MIDFKNIIKKNHSELILFSIIFLFFLQTLSDLVETIYGFALRGLEPDINIVGLAFLFSPLLLLFFRKKISDRSLFVIGEIMIVSRLIEPFLKKQGLYILAGISVACFLMFFPAYFSRTKNEEQNTSLTLGISLAISVALSILLRTLNSTVDISMYRWFQIIGWIFGIVATLMMLRLLFQDDVKKQEKDIETAKSASFGKILLLSFGLMSILVIIWFTFAGPTVITRWTEGNYIAIILIVEAMIAVFTLGILLKANWLNRLKTWMIWLWNGLFAISLTLTILVNQLRFPRIADPYPLVAPSVVWFYFIPLGIMLLLSPIIYLDFILLSRELIKIKPSPLKIGGSFSISGGLYLVIMLFMQVLPNVWGYLEPISTGFRDKYWLAFFVPGFILTLSILIVKQKSISFDKVTGELSKKTSIFIILGLIFVGTLAGAFFTKPYPNYTALGKDSLTIMTFNIQQGRNASGDRNYDSQLELIKRWDPDIIGLQECDPTRVSGGNLDVVRYFADKLNMYSYYGPNTVTNTYGCAILSKFPISNALSFYMYSDEEQIGSAQAQITIGSEIFNVFVNHPSGAQETKILQQEQMLERVVGLNDVIFMGDFNFRKTTVQYNMTTALLNDSWVVKHGSFVDMYGYNSTDKIDHIFLSSGMDVIEARYIETEQSDHPAYWIIIRI